MKHFLILVLALTLFSCSNSEDLPADMAEATILGRWVPVGFEDTIRYEFTETTRYTLYSVNGTFPTLEEFSQENPELGLDWYYEGNKVVVDLNFGNFSTLTPQFTCNNYVVKWLDDNGNTHSVYFREGYDIAQCDDID
mgnify:CR=1 FL=1